MEPHLILRSSIARIPGHDRNVMVFHVSRALSEEEAFLLRPRLLAACGRFEHCAGVERDYLILGDLEGCGTPFRVGSATLPSNVADHVARIFVEGCAVPHPHKRYSLSPPYASF